MTKYISRNNNIKMPDDANNLNSFDISNYLIELAKNRRKNFSFSTIKKKLSISDNQLELLEAEILILCPSL